MMHKSKMGDVPVMILVLGVFAVCALALLSFYFVNFKALKNFQGYLVVEEVNSLADEYAFYENIGVNSNEANRVIGIKSCAQGECIIVTKNVDGKEIKVVFPLNSLK